MINKQIIIFADSIKHHNHCVAGKCTETGEWVRPVADANGKELTNQQVQYQNVHGTYHIKPLQKINMEFHRAVPLMHQPENYIITQSLWTQSYNIKPHEIINYVDQPQDLWGQENRVAYPPQTHIEQSLYLVQVDNVELYKNGQDKRRISFEYNNIEYDLAVTSKNFDQIHDNDEAIQNILCISLGEPYQGFCYKLVAGIF